MSSGENETIPIEPIGILGVKTKMPRPERIGCRSGAKGHPGMSGVRLVHCINAQETDGIDTLLVGRRISHRISLPSWEMFEGYRHFDIACRFPDVEDVPTWLSKASYGSLVERATGMDVRELQGEIEALVANPSDIKGKAGRVVDEVIEALDTGRLRVAEPVGSGAWITNAWVKQAILLYFRRRDVQWMGDPQREALAYYDKLPVKKN